MARESAQNLTPLEALSLRADERSAQLAALQATAQGLQRQAAKDLQHLSKLKVPVTEAPAIDKDQLQKLVASLEAQANLGLVPTRTEKSSEKPKTKRRRKTRKATPKAAERQTRPRKPRKETKADLPEGFIARKDLIAKLQESHPDRTPQYIQGRVNTLATQNKDYPKAKNPRGQLNAQQAEFITTHFVPAKKGAN